MAVVLALIGLLSVIAGGTLVVLGSALTPPDWHTVAIGAATMAGGVLWLAISRALELLAQIARDVRRLADAPPRPRDD